MLTGTETRNIPEETRPEAHEGTVGQNSGRRRFHVFAAVRLMNHCFRIGDRVRVIGILADFYPGKIATVVAVRPHETGTTELDHYVIEIPDVEIGDTTFCDFQLAPTSTLNAHDSDSP